MANNIALAKAFVPLLDEAYKAGAKTSVLDGQLDLQRQGENARELVIPIMTLDGLGNYSRADGYPAGSETLTWETVQPNYDRGKMFTIDTMDNAETAGIAFGQLAAQFIKMHVTPERDAFNIAFYANNADLTASGTLATGAAVITALTTATVQLDEAETPETERYLFISPTNYMAIKGMDSYKSVAVMERFEQVIQVPSARMNSVVTLSPTAGWTAGGDKVEFLIIHKPKVIQYAKHTDVKVVAPQENQTADAWKFGYRMYAITQKYQNKVPGIYVYKYAEEEEPEDP
ncbi:hypothetical protein AGMMS49992_32110 [Clostridia bacterium]|nr:hypothetical protein AGMMS49992_32110 [Clostridia bacterium]